MTHRCAQGFSAIAQTLLEADGLWDARSGAVISEELAFDTTGTRLGDSNWVIGSTPTRLLRTHFGGGGAAQVGSWRYPLVAHGINGDGVSVGSLWDQTLTP